MFIFDVFIADEVCLFHNIDLNITHSIGSLAIYLLFGVEQDLNVFWYQFPHV
jgi:hypothetical protein